MPKWIYKTPFLCSRYTVSTTGGFFSFLFLIFAASVDHQMRLKTAVPCRRIKMIEKLDSSQLHMTNGS